MTVSVALSPIPILQFFDNTGKPAVGGSLLTQSGGVNYATYSDSAGSVPLPNPIPLNSRGEISTAAGTSTTLFLQVGVSYTFTLSDKNSNQLWSISNIYAPGNSAPTATGTANALIITNNVPISFGNGVLQWFYPLAANTAGATANVDNTGNKTILYQSKALVGGEMQPTVPALLICDGTNWNLAWSARGPATDYYAGAGTNTITLTANMAQTVYTDGMMFKWKAANTTTGNSTLNVNSIGAKNRYYSDGTTLLPGGETIANNVYIDIYDSSLNSSAGGFICINPSTITGSFTETLTGMAGSVTGTVNYRILQDGRTANVWNVAAITGTSSASTGTTMTGTGIPAILTTTTSKYIRSLVLEDAGALSLAGWFVLTGTGTIWTYGASVSENTSAFTNSGTKGKRPSFWTMDLS